MGTWLLLLNYANEMFRPCRVWLNTIGHRLRLSPSSSSAIIAWQSMLPMAADTASGYPNVGISSPVEKTLTKQQKEALSQHLEESAPGQEGSGQVSIWLQYAASVARWTTNCLIYHIAGIISMICPGGSSGCSASPIHVCLCSADVSPGSLAYYIEVIVFRPLA